MKILSLFNGMSCGEIALQQVGIIPEIYYSSEIDKYGIAQTQLNFPNTIQLGSVVDVYVSKLEPIDLLIGGSPCQSFSFAGKRKGMSTKDEIQIFTLEKYLELKDQGFEFEGQSYLFWEYMRILTDIRRYNPDVKFLLENVEMGNKWERVLSEAIGIYGVHINSALVSAQNRKRIYWTNIQTKEVGLFGELHSDIPQPKDRGILLKDVLESGVDEKYYLSDAVLARVERRHYSDPKINPDKTGCLNTKNNFGQMSVDSGTTFISVNGKAPTQRSSTGPSMDKKHNYQFIKLDKQLNMKPDQQKASCFTAGGHSGGNHSDMDLICVAMRGRNPNNPSDRTTGSPTEQRLEHNLSGKTNCLTSVQKDNLVMQLNERQQNNFKNRDEKANTFLSTSWKGSQANGMTLVVSEATEKGFIEVETGECFDFENPNSKTRRGRKMEEKSNCLMAKETDFMQHTPTNRIRRLTPTECARLQTIPDWYKWECSDTQEYKMCGNGWTVDIIAHIFSFIKNIL